MLKTLLERLAFIIIRKAHEFGAEPAPVDCDSGSDPTDDDVAILEDTRDNLTARSW